MIRNRRQPKITLAVASVKYSFISAVFFIDIAEILIKGVYYFLLLEAKSRNDISMVHRNRNPD